MEPQPDPIPATRKLVWPKLLALALAVAAVLAVLWVRAEARRLHQRQPYLPPPMNQ